MQYLNLVFAILIISGSQSARANVDNCLQMKQPVKVHGSDGSERSLYTKKLLIDEDLPNESSNQKICYFGFFYNPKVYYCATDEGRVGDDNMGISNLEGSTNIHTCKTDHSLWSTRPEFVGLPYQRYGIAKVEFARNSDGKLHFHLFNRSYRDSEGQIDITSHIISNGYYDFTMDEL